MKTKTRHRKTTTTHTQTRVKKLRMRAPSKGRVFGHRSPGHSASQVSAPSSPEKKTRPYTHRIKILGVGTDEKEARYLVLQIDKQRIVMRVGNLTTNRSDEFARLERSGVPLIVSKAQDEFMSLAQEEAGKEPKFRIVTRTGWDGLTFYFPDRVVPQKATGVEFYLDQSLSDIHRRYHRAGTRAGRKELLSLCHNNSRLLLCVALSFVGPLLVPLAGETVGLQLCGAPGTGKNVTGIVASSTWGWDPNPNHKLGFGTGWNTTLNAVEPTLLGYNETMAFLNETRIMSDEGRGREAAILDAIMLAAEGEGKARYTKAGTRSYQTPILSTSNPSVVAMLRAAKLPFDAAYVDRMIDVPAPGDGSSFFEDLHDYPDLEAFGVRLQELAGANHGWLGFYFVRELARALASDRAEILEFVKARRRAYKRRASKIVAHGRDLRRVHGKLATVYAAGCLAIRFKLLPFTRAELLEAILKCERDHVSFVANEMGLPPQDKKQTLTATTPTPFEALEAYISGPASRTFIDLRKEDATVPKGHVHAKAPGYLGRHQGRREIWLPYARFERIAGGAAEAKALKLELRAKGLIVSEPRGKKHYFSVKREIRGLGRERVIALRLKR